MVHSAGLEPDLTICHAIAEIRPTVHVMAGLIDFACPSK